MFSLHHGMQAEFIENVKRSTKPEDQNFENSPFSTYRHSNNKEYYLCTPLKVLSESLSSDEIKVWMYIREHKQ